ncbi:MAG: (Fe-S)-binding protein, partial [Dehalococcoidia bacterium]|nr:(Fe-S)-binding protein [Dehalococcoidia bacterium]
LRLGRLEAKVTYHDPCDLGRNSGVYEAPREVLRSIPGLTLVEMLHHREEALCCGGGGDFEMLAPAMTQKIATRLVQEAVDASAQRLVVACPQCKRIEMSGAEALGFPVQVTDIAELVREAMLSVGEPAALPERGGAHAPG